MRTVLIAFYLLASANIQAQFQDIRRAAGGGGSGGGSTLTNGVASRAVVTDVSTNLTSSTTTATELGYVNGVTSAIQTQLNGKQATASTLTALSTNTITGTGTIPLSSVTDGKQPLSATLTAASTNSFTGTGTIPLSSQIPTVPANIVINTGASTTTKFPQYSDTSGTSVAPHTITLASSDFANQGTATTVAHGNAAGNPSWAAVNLAADVTGTLAADQFPALTGDITTSAGALATALKATGTAGTYTSVTTDAQGRVTAGSNPAVTSAANWTASGTTNSTLAGNASVNALTATNGITGSDLSASQAVFTDGNKKLVSTGTSAALAAALSDETGTGKAVFNDVPSFTGQVKFPDGVAGEPGVGFTSKTNSGVYYDNGNSAVVVAVTGVAQLAVFNGGPQLGSASVYAWGGASSPTSSTVLAIGMDSAGVLQLGLDVTTPTNQAIKANDATGTDHDAASFTLEGGQSTGTGRGGDLIIRTANTSTTGSSANSYTERYHASAKFVNLTESSATTIANIPLASSKYMSVVIYGSILANDGTDFQAVSSRVSFSGVNKGGTVTVGTLTQTDDGTAASAGTLTVTYTAVANSASIDIKANAVSSLTQTILRAKYIVTAINSDDAIVVTPQ